MEALNQQFIERMYQDETKLRHFLELSKLAKMEKVAKFGSSPKWNEMSIKEKTYHGWMKNLLVASEAGINDRWGYWLELCATKDVSKDIPQLDFYTRGDENYAKVMSMINECLNPPFHYNGSMPIQMKFIDWLLHGWGSPTVKRIKIEDRLNKYWYENFKGELMFMFPGDYLTPIAGSIRQGVNNPGAFFPTPEHVSKMMVEMSMNKSSKFDKVNDPCCGTARFLLYASNYSLRIYAQDLDLLMVKVTELQGWFYIPWMVVMPEEIDKLLEEAYKSENSKGVR